METQDEKNAVAASLGGDASAFGTLYEAHVRRIYDFVYYRTHHRETAEDITSQVFLNAYRKLRTYDPAKGSFAAWLYRIARNAVIDHYRSARPTTDIEDVWDAIRSGEDPARDAEARERLEKVSGLLMQLTAAQRDIVIMRVWDGMSYAEIAAAVGKSEAACKMAFSRALSALKDKAPLIVLLLMAAKP